MKQRVRLGRCPICKRNDVPLVRDHDHATGLHRQRICRSCNALLGFARDEIRTLLGAVAYLKTERPDAKPYR